MAYISRGRDIRKLIKDHGEVGMAKACVMLAEDNVALQQEIADMRKVLGAVIKMQENITGAMGGLQGAMELIEKKYRPNSEAHDDAGA